MNRVLILAIGLAIALVGPVSAAGFRYMAPASPLRVVAGEIGPDGSVMNGSGFTAHRVGVGQYVIRFQNDSIRGCAAVFVTPVGEAYYGAAASQAGCGRKVAVNIGSVGYGLQDSTFQFVAVEEK